MKKWSEKRGRWSKYTSPFLVTSDSLQQKKRQHGKKDTDKTVKSRKNKKKQPRKQQQKQKKKDKVKKKRRKKIQSSENEDDNDEDTTTKYNSISHMNYWWWRLSRVVEETPQIVSTILPDLEMLPEVHASKPSWLMRKSRSPSPVDKEKLKPQQPVKERNLPSKTDKVCLPTTKNQWLH